MNEMLQHAIVSLVALLAAWVVVRRIVGTFGPSRDTKQSCPTCASGCAHAARDPRRQGQ